MRLWLWFAIISLLLSPSLQSSNEEETTSGIETNSDSDVKNIEETLQKSFQLLMKTLETKNITNFNFSLNLSQLIPPNNNKEDKIVEGHQALYNQIDLTSPLEKTFRLLGEFDYLLLFLSSPCLFYLFNLIYK